MSDIVVRKVKFDFPDELDDVFPGDDIVAETYLAAFSLTMPYLEPYPIRTYRAVADRSDGRRRVAGDRGRARARARLPALQIVGLARRRDSGHDGQ